MPPTRECPGCERQLQPEDRGYVYLWECDADDCGWADAIWNVYDWEVFAEVKAVQRAVGTDAAGRVAAEYADGVLS